LAGFFAQRCVCVILLSIPIGCSWKKRFPNDPAHRSGTLLLELIIGNAIEKMKPEPCSGPAGPMKRAGLGV
jgi:hypothetical protein